MICPVKAYSLSSTITCMYDIICVTNRKLCTGDFLETLERAVMTRPYSVILREKDLSEEEYISLAEKAMEICRRYDVPCILHTFADAAIKLGCTALHLPMPLLRVLPEEKKKHFSVLGASCHRKEEAVEARKLGASYITAGHIFATDCKKGVPPRGIDFLREVCGAVDIPVFAIGGITPERLKDTADAGAAGGCMMSRFFF